MATKSKRRRKRKRKGSQALAVHHPHDTRYRTFFAHWQMIVDIIVGYVPLTIGYRLVEVIRRDTVHVTRSGRRHYEDMVWEIKVARNDTEAPKSFFLLLEFQSEPDVWMAVRMMIYSSLTLQAVVQGDHLEAGSMPEVLPMVLYSGIPAWTTATDLAALRRADVAFPELLAHQPALGYLLVQRTTACRTADNLLVALLALELPLGPGEILGIIRTLKVRLAGAEQFALRHEFCQLIHMRLTSMTEIAASQTYDLEDLERELERVFHSGEGTWWAQWRAAFKQEGEREGELKGELKGERTLLLQLLGNRFGILPEWVEERMKHATQEEIFRWAAKVLEPAVPLDQVFQSPNP